MKEIAGAVLLVLGTLVMARAEPRPSHAKVQTRESQAAMTPTAAIDRLLAGNKRFATNRTQHHDWSAKVVGTAGGQFPFAAVLACMDSRVPVEIVFDQGVGDLFAVRVAGNIVNDDELGSLEYAVKVGSKLIVVLGHTNCGAVKGAIDHVELGNLTGLLAKIRPAVEAAGCNDSKDEACVEKVAAKNVLHSMKEIRDRSPYIATGLGQGTIGMVGAMYNVSTGRVTFLEP
jgi:carbonic anhydrase